MSTSSLGYSATTLNDLLRRLHTIGAVKIDTQGGFKLKLHEKNPNAPLSPLYINLRIAENKGGPLTFAEVAEIAKFFHAYLRANNVQFDGICPVPHAGTPFAKELQEIYKKEGRSIPILTLGKEEDASGRHIGVLLETQGLSRGCKVLLVDDLITKAGSKLEAIKALLNAGHEVTDCMVFLDREQGGPREMAELGVTLHSIVGLTSALEVYKSSGALNSEQYTKIREYLKQAA
jgi:orotate phosphoribosyltransferase